MANTDVKVRGLSELQQFLDQLPAKLEASVLRSALKAGADCIKEEVQSRVPVDTGRLRDSIRVSVRSRRGVVTATVSVGGRDTRKRTVVNASGKIKVKYDNAWYAHLIEFTGAKPHQIKAKFAKALQLRANKRASSGFARRWVRGEMLVEGVRHPGFHPRPFVRPAIDAKAQAAAQIVGEAIKKRLATKHGLDTSAVEIGS